MKKTGLCLDLLWSQEALAPDLFRLRATRAKHFDPTPSWAVTKTAWPPLSASRKRRSSGGSLTSAEGRLSWGEDNRWELRDRHGLVLFRAGKKATGYLEASPRLTLELEDGESLFGLGEVSGQFNRRGLSREFWNTDVLGHAPAIHPELKSLYVSIPFVISLRHGRAAGLFWDNPAKQSWDMGNSRPDAWSLTAESGEIDLYLFLGPTVEAVVSRFTELTGKMPMPPRWALGYHQCRYSYETAGRLEEIGREFRRRKIPCDALYLDIHHMDAYRVFTFGKTFPKPAAMVSRLAAKGFRTVAIVDPGVKNDPGFGVLKRGVKEDAFVKQADGKHDVVGEVWPGESKFPDFFSPKVRAWWGDEQKTLLDAGIAGVWNDMNEPANFARPDKTLAPDALHRTGHGPRPHREVHNVYGSKMAQASREGMLRHAPATRPFVITRAGYAGVQRDAIVWTGDTSSTWDHLHDSVQILLNLSLSGVPFCGGDVGGFLGNATPELFTRWLQFAAFTPFCRGHTNIGTVDHEPWAFGKEAEDICRHYLELRYRLLPYFYSLCAEAARSGSPIIRPLFWHYQNDPAAAACGDQFLLGRDILVAPVLRQGATARSVYLPNDVWFDFWTGERFQGGTHIAAETPPELIPVFVRAGAILPMDEARLFVGQAVQNIVYLNIWPGIEGELRWYEDDGSTRSCENGVFSRRSISSRTEARTLTLRFDKSEGTFESKIRTWRVIAWDMSPKARVRINGKALKRPDGNPESVLVFDVENRPDSFRVELAGI